MYKRLFSFTMIFIIIATFTLNTYAVSNQILSKDKFVCEATLEDEFADDSVVIVLTNDVSKKLKTYGKNDFGSKIDVEKVEDLTKHSVASIKAQRAMDMAKMKASPVGFSQAENSQSNGLLNESKTDASLQQINEDEFNQIIRIDLKTKSKEHVLEMVKELEKRADVLSAEPNYFFYTEELPEEMSNQNAEPENSQDNANIDGNAAPEAVPNDTQYSQQYAHAKINSSAAWNTATGSYNIKVGVIDTGIASHTDLSGNLTSGWDFFNNSSVTNDVANYPHGTHVAGIIGALGNNGLGVCGVNWDVTLVPLQVVITDGSSSDGMLGGSAIISAINYANSNNIPVINCSFGSLRPFFAYETQMRNYYGLVVCAAGNDGVNTDVNPHDPSCSTLENIISVASTNNLDQLATSSNYGAVSVDLAAPGVSIYSTIPGNTYGNMSGTSMAAPHVAGVAALIKSVRPDLTTEQVKYCIMAGVDKLSVLTNKCVSGGRLNAKKALDLAIAIPEDTIVSGDYNGDGKGDIARVTFSGLDSAGHDQMKVYVSLGGTTTTTLWNTSNWYTYASVKGRIIAGCFTGSTVNGKKRDDLAMLYDYGNGTSKLHVFRSTGTAFSTWQVWYNAPNPWEYSTGAVGGFAAGDFNNDGKDDIATIYDYGEGTSKIHVFKSAGTTFNSWQTWYNAPNPWEYCVSAVGGFAAGDFNNDGKDDIATIYDYGEGRSQMHVFKSAGTTFNSWEVWHNAPNPWQYCVGAVYGFAAGDYNNDGKDDIATIYDYGEGRSQIHVFKSAGTTFNAGQVWYNAPNLWEYNTGAVGGFVSADINGDGKCDIVTKYQYPDGRRPLHLFTSQTTYFSSWTVWRNL